MLCEEFSHDGVRKGEESPGEGEIPVLLFTTSAGQRKETTYFGHFSMQTTHAINRSIT